MNLPMEAIADCTYRNAVKHMAYAVANIER